MPRPRAASAPADFRIPAPRRGESDELTGVVEAVLAPATPALVEPQVAPALARPLSPRRRGQLELSVAALAALAVGVLVGAPLLLAAAVAAVWAALALQLGGSVATPGSARSRGLVAAASPPIAMAGLASAWAHADAAPAMVGSTVLMVLVASGVTLGSRLLTRSQPVRAVVLGDGPGIEEAAARWAGDRTLQVVGGCLVEDLPVVVLPKPLPSAPLYVGAECLGELVDETRADVVLVVPGRSATPERVREAAWLLEGRPVGLAVLGALDTVAPHRVGITSFAGATLLHVAPSRPGLLVRATKDVLDRAAALVLLALVSPLLLLIAALIRWESTGAAMFRQVRVGHHGRLFTIYKLRTMCADAEQLKAALSDDNESDGVLFKMHADPRVTRVGKFLRRSSLDELPQLINVVKGEMSLTGPRPALPDEVAAYDEATRRRLAVKPGITGLWQVSGRSDLPWDEAVRLDLHYADNWRLRDDAAIVLRTAGAVVSSRGAY